MDEKEYFKWHLVFSHIEQVIIIRKETFVIDDQHRE